MSSVHVGVRRRGKTKLLYLRSIVLPSLRSVIQEHTGHEHVFTHWTHAHTHSFIRAGVKETCVSALLEPDGIGEWSSTAARCRILSSSVAHMRGRSRYTIDRPLKVSGCMPDWKFISLLKDLKTLNVFMWWLDRKQNIDIKGKDSVN